MVPIDVLPTDDLKAVLDGAQPGDEVIIHAGTYGPFGFTDFQWNGTEADPIIIRANDGDAVVIMGDASQNTWNISGSYYEVRDLEFVGGSHGIRLASSAHATFENLTIHGVDDVGISCNRPGETYEDVTIRRVEIYDTGQGGGPGECMYLGCNDDGCQVWDSLIEWNYCHHTSGSQGDGIELKTGSYNTIIRHNVIHDVQYPGITMYGTVANKTRNVVEGNVVWNVVDNGIQTVGDVIVRNNIVFNVGANGIHAKPSQSENVEQATYVHNTVVNGSGVCFKTNDWDQGSGNIVVANNLFLCEGGQAINAVGGDGGASLAANGVVGSVAGFGSGTVDLGSVAAVVVSAAGMDLWPVETGPAVDAGEVAHAAARDFNCEDRDQPDRGDPDLGAYEWRATQNPGWMIQEAFKACAADPGGTSGGSGGSDSDGGTGPMTDSPTDSGSATAGDAGSSRGSGSGSGTGSGSGSGGTDGAGETDDGSGCSCRSGSNSDSPAGLGVLILGVVRRRRS